MKQYTCRHPHPSRPGECGRKLITGDFAGEIEVDCKKCGMLSVVDGRDMYAVSVPVDKPGVAVVA